jgi:hypothetical protein
MVHKHLQLPSGLQATGISLAMTYNSPTEYLLGSDNKVVFHTKTPYDASSWIASTSSDPFRSFTAFVELQGQMLAVGQGTDGPVASATPAHPNVFMPVANEPPSYYLVDVTSNWYSGATVYVVFAAGYNATLGGGAVLTSTDGKTWQVLTTQANLDIKALAYLAYCSTPSVIVGGTSMLVSLDAGVTWAAPLSPPSTLSSSNYVTALHAVSYSTAVLATSGGELYYSADCGNTWEPSAMT